MFCAFAFWELWPCGLLHRLPLGTLKPAGPPRPALVVPRPKPKSAWLRADDDFDEAQRALAREDWQEIEKPCHAAPGRRCGHAALASQARSTVSGSR